MYFLLFDAVRAADLIPAGSLFDAGEGKNQAHNQDAEQDSEQSGV